MLSNDINNHVAKIAAKLVNHDLVSIRFKQFVITFIVNLIVICSYDRCNYTMTVSLIVRM